MFYQSPIFFNQKEIDKVLTTEYRETFQNLQAKLAKLENILVRSKNATAKAYGLNPAPMASDLLNKERVK
jgi:hypothetical protein